MDEFELVAYYGSSGPSVRIEPASRSRDWMSGAGNNAKRCLPMVIANQAGWFLLNQHAFTAVWNGDEAAEGVELEFDGGVKPPNPQVESHFGLGIVTWNVGYLFRTPAGFNLLVRGPANMPKDGISALEGLVETDWSTATFTMNWKLTRPGLPVRFEAGEPFCMVVPQRRGELESFRPAVRSLKSNGELHESAKAFAESRHEQHVRKFLAEHMPGRQIDLRSWEKHYYKGRRRDGAEAPEHQNRLHLAEFTDG